MSFLQELRRRKVFRVAALYIIGAWVVLQVSDLAFESWGIPSLALRYIWLGVFLGFPLALVFGWRYDITTRGIVRTPPADAATQIDLSLRRSDYVILALLGIVAVGVIYQLTIQISDSRSPALVEISQQDIKPNSIAVLPLENLSGNPEQAYFVSGMQDALIAGLSRISALRVTSKTSTMRYANTVESLPRIAAQLGVTKLIEGSIFRVDNRVRITVKLVDAKLDEHIWSQTFENEVRDVLSLQSEVAKAIAEQVEVTLTSDEQAQLSNSGTIDPDAYDAFMKGQFHVERFTPQDTMLASEYFAQAIELDPDHALPYSGLAKLCAFQSQNYLITPKEARGRCLLPVEKALSLDDSLPEAHIYHAVHLIWRLFDWEAGEAAFRRAIELNPSYAEARMFYSHYLAIMGRAEESSDQIRMALELDPLNPFVQAMYAVQLLMVGDMEGALRVCEDVTSSNPGFGFSHDNLMMIYHHLGEQEKAIAAAADFIRITLADPASALEIETAYAERGYQEAFLEIAEAAVELSNTVYVAPWDIYVWYELGGDMERAIDWAEIATHDYDPSAPYFGALSQYSSTRSNPRFIELLRDMRLDYWADKYSQPDE